MKKNVKKVTIGVLSCSLLLTMSACTKKRSAEEVLQDSLKASAKQENIDATGKVDCKIVRLKVVKRVHLLLDPA